MEPDEAEEGAVVEQRVPEEPETEEASLNMGDSVATTPGFLTPMCWPREAPYPAPEPEPSQYAPPQVGALCDTHPVAADMFSTTFLTEQTVENDEEEPEPEPEPDPEPEPEPEPESKFAAVHGQATLQQTLAAAVATHT